MSRQSELSKAIFKDADHYITSPFGWRTHPISGKRIFHSGTDYGTHRKKVNQYAVEEGVVRSAGRSSTGALFAWVVYKRLGVRILHYHMDSVNVKAGQKVTNRTIIGTTGTTGNSTGIHLHMGVRDLKTDRYINGHTFKIPAKPKPKPKPSANVLWTGKVAISGLNVRPKPTMASKPTSRLNKGRIISVYEEVGNDPFIWLRVDGGYVSNARGEYVDEVKTQYAEYIIRSGDTLGQIARKFEVTVQELVDANDIKNADRISVGRPLIIPNNERLYKVKSGDNLGIIANKFKTTVNKIAEDNGIKNVNIIRVGQILKV